MQPEAPVTQPETQSEQTRSEVPVEAPVEVPDQPAAVSDPEPETQPALPETPAVPDLPEVIPEPVPDEAPEPAPESLPGQQASGGNSSPGQSGREPFSERYPFRRVKMNPEPGIRADAAGTPVWPKAVSPLQQMER